MAIESEFPSVEAMKQMIAMGMDEGMSQAAADRRDPGGSMKLTTVATSANEQGEQPWLN